MKILSLHLSNYLSYEDATFDFAPLTVIRGENGAGKTSIEQALQIALAGFADATSAKGAGMGTLIRAGKNEAVVTISIEEDGVVRDVRCRLREGERKLGCRRADDPGYTGTDYLESLALRRDVLSCLINSRVFFGKDPADQKALLASIMLPATFEPEAWVFQAIVDAGLMIRRDQKPFEFLAAGYDAAYIERTAVNRMIKEWREPESVAPLPLSLEEIRARLAERQAARTEIALKRQKSVDGYERAKAARVQIAGKIESVTKKRAEDYDRRTTIAKDELSPKAIKEAEALAAGEKRAKEIEAEILKGNGALAEVRRMLAKLNDIGEAGSCPTCTQVVTDAEFEHIAKPFLEKQDGLLTAERRLQDERKGLGDWEGAVRVLAAHAAAKKNLELVDRHIEGYDHELADLRKREVAEVPEPDTAALDAELSEIDERIQKGNAALQEAIQADGKRKQYDDAIAAKKRLGAKLDLLEKLVAYFGPKGAQAKLLADHVGPFQAKMNETLAGWGFLCNLSFEPYEFRVWTSSRPDDGSFGFPLKTLSKSQRASFAIAFQVALAIASGLKFVFADEADLFLDGNRQLLYRALLSAGLDQVVIAQSDERKTVPGADCALYFLTLDKSKVPPATVVERLK